MNDTSKSKEQEAQKEFRPMGPGNPIEPNSATELIAEIFAIIKSTRLNRREKLQRIDKECEDYLMYHPEYLQQREQPWVRVEEVVNTFREFVMRGNYAFPENEQDLKWSNDGISKSGDLFQRMIKILKLDLSERAMNCEMSLRRNIPAPPKY